MRYLLLAALLLANLTGAFAQIPGRATLNYVFNGETENSPTLTVPLTETKHFVSFALRCTGVSTDGILEFRYSSDGSTWADWQILHDDMHAAEPTGHRQFELLFLPANTRYLQLRASGLKAVLNAEVFLFSPINGLDTDPAPAPAAVDYRSCPCSMPNLVNRAGWGGPPNQQPNCTPSYANVTHLFVHHQAGAANPPYAAVVYSIWQYHVFTRGWCDIGYNWVIAPDGTLFEGRAGGNNVVGAHVTGVNTGSMGVCMLGDFQTDQPTAAALETLRRLFAWKCCDSGINPVGASVHSGSGLMLNHISGHRDAGATLCPGDNLYAKLPLLRLNTDSLYRDPTGCDGLWPPSNDNCAATINLLSAESCMLIAATTNGATASGVAIPSCSGFVSPTALDVWFRFSAAENHHRVKVTPSGNPPNALDAVVAVYDGACGALQLVACVDVPGGAGVETSLDLPNLTPGHVYQVRVFDYGNAPAADGRFDICVLHGAAVGTDETLALHSLRIYPNPTRGWVRVEAPVDGNVLRIFGLEGQLVQTHTVTAGNTDLDLSGLTPGVYFAVLQTATGIWRQKIVLH